MPYIYGLELFVKADQDIFEVCRLFLHVRKEMRAKKGYMIVKSHVNELLMAVKSA